MYTNFVLNAKYYFLLFLITFRTWLSIYVKIFSIESYIYYVLLYGFK